MSLQKLRDDALCIRNQKKIRDVIKQCPQVHKTYCFESIQAHYPKPHNKCCFRIFDEVSILFCCSLISDSNFLSLCEFQGFFGDWRLAQDGHLLKQIEPSYFITQGTLASLKECTLEKQDIEKVLLDISAAIKIKMNDEKSDETKL